MGKTIKMIGQINRLVFFVILAFNVYYSANLKLPMNPVLNKGGPWKYLTIWNLVLQTMYWGLVNIGQFMESKKTRKIGYLDIFFHSIILPLSMIVTFTFWAIYSLNPELILPKVIRPFFPEWHNQSIHTLVLIGPLIEAICTSHKIPTRKQGLKVFLFLLVTYLVNMHYFGFVHGNFIYPFLNQMAYPYKLVFFVFMGIMSLGFYFLSEKFHHSVAKIK
ncbi:androgen-dependent TFPI-regulating protein-like [Brevipalpus obovatus]|uniref:androgen-dependent TFPI-regulating protein-like n=1 Tax=Brevipalpus obovatus TaxID=246614 RepID=UPI003D9EABE8